MRLSRNRGDTLEVRVVVEDGEIGRLRGCGDDQIGDGQAVVSRPSQPVLYGERSTHDLWGDGHIGQRTQSRPGPLVIGQVPGAVQDFGSIRMSP